MDCDHTRKLFDGPLSGGADAIDTLKTVSQVEVKGTDAVFRHSIRKGNVRNLYTGSYAMFLATLMGHYPWFATYNASSRIVPRQEVRA